MKIVLVEWYDSNYSQGWKCKSHIRDEHISPCISCGIVLRRDEKEIVLGLSLSEDNYADTMSIPMGCVKRIRCLKVR